MARIKLSLGCVQNYDRTGPLLEGRIQPDGIEFVPTALGPVELFRRMAQFAEFDVAEMSVSTYMVLLSRGDDRYVALPIFPSRSFRHGFVFYNANSGITRLEDLKGRRVGVAEYVETAAVWIRGFLNDDYGVRSEDMEWVQGGLDVHEPERLPIDMPEQFKIERVPADRTLSEMLERGEIDALLGARAPGCFKRGAPHIRRFFPNYREVERAYFERTGFFPIMHLVVLRRSIYEQNRWMAQNIFDAFNQAKNAGLARLWDTGSLASALPWLLNDMEEMRDVFGGDAWPYGMERNRAALEYLAEKSYEQGLSARRLQLNEIFVSETRDT
jgi:4,5-dihydroxyphthalate decarboxylase